MNADQAIALLDVQICPCGLVTTPEVEVDEERAIAFEQCAAKHLWPYAHFSQDHSTNAFEGGFDPVTIAEQLEEYGL
jgi:hypothetical protein